MSRHERRAAILRLIRERELATQAELALALRELGHDAVQATVSRDIAELGLVKVRAPSGRLVYAPPGGTDVERLRALADALRRWALTIEPAGNLVLVTTPSGFANALAQIVDQASHPAVAGTVAGDNTILVVARDGFAAADLCREFTDLTLKGAA